MATLRERLDSELKDSMRAKDELKTSVLRMVKSAMKYKEVEPGATALSDEGIVNILTTLVKQRRDSADQFKQGGRPELADKEEKEIAIIQSYLPKQLTAAELTAAVAKAIVDSGAKSAKDMGAVMKLVSGPLKGQAEGKAISEEVKAQLSKLG